jgi:hypothetical protein
MSFIDKIPWIFYIYSVGFSMMPIVHVFLAFNNHDSQVEDRKLRMLKQ